MLLEFLARQSHLFSFLTCLFVRKKKRFHTFAVGSTGIKLFETTKICIVPLEARATGILNGCRIIQFILCMIDVWTTWTWQVASVRSKRSKSGRTVQSADG
jgi:hypothetical protein